MSESRRLQEERLLELLVEKAESGLADAPSRELAQLLWDSEGQVDEDGYELAAAAAYRVFESETVESREPIPTELAERVIAEGEKRVGVRPGEASSPTLKITAPSVAGSVMRHPAWGWMAAAAVLAVSVTAFVLTRGGGEMDYESLRGQLLAQAPDVTLAEWTPSDRPVYGEVTGDVVWSDREQRGYMRLVGMPVNDPGREQYQLWIVDPDVDTHPVDGGVFDIKETGEVIVPIHAKLRVDKPTVFAITVERPGGVVVSDGPLEVVAAVGS